MGELKSSRKRGLLADERDPRHRSSKDTKRWCKGRIGVEHRKLWSDNNPQFRTRFNLPYYEVLSCVECGKEFEKVPKKWTVPMVIRALRMAKGLTQEELGTLCGMEQSRIASIEAGDNDCNLKTISRLAKALNVTTVLHFYDGGDVCLNQETH